MTQLEQHMIAYYVAGPAFDLTIATRWYPYSDLELIIEDKFNIATRKFGMKVRKNSKAAGKLFLDMMIGKGAWIAKPNDFGGSMYQFQLDVWRSAIRELQASDPIIQQANAEGPEFWDKAFGALVA